MLLLVVADSKIFIPSFNNYSHLFPNIASFFLLFSSWFGKKNILEIIWLNFIVLHPSNKVLLSLRPYYLVLYSISRFCLSLIGQKDSIINCHIFACMLPFSLSETKKVHTNPIEYYESEINNTIQNTIVITPA